jgi:hypothetical protein
MNVFIVLVMTGEGILIYNTLFEVLLTVSWPRSCRHHDNELVVLRRRYMTNSQTTSTKWYISRRGDRYAAVLHFRTVRAVLSGFLSLMTTIRRELRPHEKEVFLPDVPPASYAPIPSRRVKTHFNGSACVPSMTCIKSLEKQQRKMKSHSNMVCSDRLSGMRWCVSMICCICTATSDGWMGDLGFVQPHASVGAEITGSWAVPTCDKSIYAGPSSLRRAWSPRWRTRYILLGI